MSVSSVGSTGAFSLKWLQQADSASSSSNANPTDALKSLFDAITGGSSGSSDPLMAALGQDSGSDSSGGSCGMPQFSADTMSALLSMQSQQGGPAAGIAQDVIAKFDTDGDGQVSQSEFENAIGSSADQSGVDALFNKLDSNGDGSASADELQSAMQKAHGGGHHHHHVEASSDSSQQQGSDPLQALLSGASADGTSSQTSTNSDGSSTTTITYADGTKLEMTTPAASGDGSSGSGNSNQFNLGNLLKMMVNLQAQLAPSTTNVSV